MDATTLQAVVRYQYNKAHNEVITCATPSHARAFCLLASRITLNTDTGNYRNVIRDAARISERKA